MALTPTQQTTLKDDITPLLLGGQEFDGLDPVANGDDAYAIASAYNLQASPDFYVWEELLSLEIVGTALDGTNIGDLTTANANRLSVFLQSNPGGVIPSRTDHRAFFDDVFSGAGGTETRTALDLAWKRLSLRVEQLLSTGTGTTLSPATLGREGTINFRDVQNAMNS